MAEKTGANESAFPRTLYYDEQPIDCTQGITKREFFAAMALAGLLADLGTIDLETAKDAVKAADHLITALKAQQKSDP